MKLMNWWTERAVPRYVFFVMWALFMERILTDAADRHWPKATLAGLAFGVIVLIVVYGMYYKSRLRKPE
jgi:hypothetical protein